MEIMNLHIANTYSMPFVSYSSRKNSEFFPFSDALRLCGLPVRIRKKHLYWLEFVLIANILVILYVYIVIIAMAT